MTTATVPGKLILLGEHAAVYGRPALVAAVGLRLRARATAAPTGARGVSLRLGALPAADGRHGQATEVELAWPEVLRRAETARHAWERYAADPGPESFSALAATGSGPLHLLQVALGEAARAAGDDAPPPLRLEIDSEIPVGSGFGSSAAAAVGVVLAYLAHRGVEADPGLLHRVTLEVERRQHGTPSGIDNGTVIQGGILEARRSETRRAGAPSPGGDPGGEAAGPGVAFQPVPVRSRLLASTRVYGTGSPAEGTGTVVAAVRALRRREPERVEGTLDRLGALTGRLRRELESPGERPERVLEILREAAAGLEELGVVPAPVRELVRAIERAGGAAKISGAGSLDGPGAGNLLVYHPDPETLDALPELAGRVRYRVALGVPGARLGAPSQELASP